MSVQVSPCSVCHPPKPPPNSQLTQQWELSENPSQQSQLPPECPKWANPLHLKLTQSHPDSFLHPRWFQVPSSLALHNPGMGAQLYCSFCTSLSPFCCPTLPAKTASTKTLWPSPLGASADTFCFSTGEQGVLGLSWGQWQRTEDPRS